jgi:hypothetical protein
MSRLRIVVASLIFLATGVAQQASDQGQLQEPESPGAQSSEVHSKGTLGLGANCAYDLDAGKDMCWIDLPPQRDEKTHDFWFQWDGKRQYFNPRNGAVLAMAGRRAVDLAGCRGAHYRTGRLRVDGLPVGSHICVRTSEGRYADVRFETPVNTEPHEMTISFVTWER